MLCSTSAVLSCGIIEPSEFCHGFSNRYLCLLYLFSEYVQESGQESFWGPLSMMSLIVVVKPIERSCFSDGTRDNAMYVAIHFCS